MICLESCHVLSLWECLDFAEKAWNPSSQSPQWQICAAVSRYICVYWKGEVRRGRGGTGEVRNGSISSTRTPTFTDVKQQYRASLKVQVWRLRKCGSLCAEWALCQLVIFHVGWGAGAAQATLTEGFPSWWVLRHTRHPKSLSFLFMETVKNRPLFYHD